MKVTCNRETLLAACQVVAAAVAPRTTKPVLTCLKFVAEAGVLTVMATDLEIGIRHGVAETTIDRDGAAILSPTKLVPILRNATDETVMIDAYGSYQDNVAFGITVTTGRGRFDLPYLDPAEFPDVFAFDGVGQPFEVSAGAFKHAIRRTAFAADKSETMARWAVTGVLIEVGRTVRLTATDTRRVASFTLAGHEAGPEKAVAALLPSKAAQLVDRAITDADGWLNGILSPNEARFAVGPVVIVTKLLEGRFPPYRDIVPKAFVGTFELPAGDLLAVVRDAAIMTNEESKRVEFKFEPGKLTLTARGGADIGAGEVRLPLAYEGDEFEIAFNPQFLIDMLRTTDEAATVTLEAAGAERPAVFRDGDNYFYLVMPLSA